MVEVVAVGIAMFMLGAIIGICATDLYMNR